MQTFIDFPGLIAAANSSFWKEREFFSHQILRDLRAETELGVFNFQTDMDFIMDKHRLSVWLISL